MLTQLATFINLTSDTVRIYSDTDKSKFLSASRSEYVSLSFLPHYGNGNEVRVAKISDNTVFFAAREARTFTETANELRCAIDVETFGVPIATGDNAYSTDGMERKVVRVCIFDTLLAADDAGLPAVEHSLYLVRPARFHDVNALLPSCPLSRLKISLVEDAVLFPQRKNTFYIVRPEVQAYVAHRADWVTPVLPVFGSSLPEIITGYRAFAGRRVLDV